MKFSCRSHGIQEAMTLTQGTVVCKKCYDEQIIGKDVKIDGKTVGKVVGVRDEGGLDVLFESETLVQINS